MCRQNLPSPAPLTLAFEIDRRIRASEAPLDFVRRGTSIVFPSPEDRSLLLSKRRLRVDIVAVTPVITSITVLRVRSSVNSMPFHLPLVRLVSRTLASLPSPTTANFFYPSGG